MTENERQAVLRDIRYGYMDVWDSLIMDELFKQIEEEHKEIQQYKAIGSAEGYERAINLSIENYKLYREYKAKVQKFEAIGTIEEFKALKEKMQDVEITIINRMQEFYDEYRSISQSRVDHFGGKADAIEISQNIVKGVFKDVLGIDWQ